MMHGIQDKQSQTLPRLPIMLIQAVTTIRRKGAADNELSSLNANYTAQLDQEHLTEYKDTFHQFSSNQPLSYFYLFAQRAHLALMLDEEFPWPILGMVHVSNEMKQCAEIDFSQELTLAVTIDFPARAASRRIVRLNYTVEFYQGDELKLQCFSVYQVGQLPDRKKIPRSHEALDLTHWQALDQWPLDSHLGFSYAKLSGDFNPIHLHSWLSRWFGFEQPIIHGMYSVARAQASVEHFLKGELTELHVNFKKPIFLPAELQLYVNATEGLFMVTDSEAKEVYLSGDYCCS